MTSILSEIQSFIMLLRQNAKRALEMEAYLRVHPMSMLDIADLHDRLRERQRDMSSLIRMMQLIEKQFVEDGMWSTECKRRHRALFVENKRVERKYDDVDALFFSLRQEIREAEEGHSNGSL
jgi:hypothetical protein